MTDLLIRDLDPILTDRIRRVAQARGWSTEETISRLIFMLDGGEFKYQQTFSGELVLRDSVIDGPHR